jgi:hypothetical protein
MAQFLGTESLMFGNLLVVSIVAGAGLRPPLAASNIRRLIWILQGNDARNARDAPRLGQTRKRASEQGRTTRGCVPG